MSMRTLAQQLEDKLTKPVVVKIQRSVIRQELPEQRAFNVAVRIGSIGNLGRLSYLCGVARRTPTARKIEEAKQAMLEFLQKHTAKGARHLAVEQFVMLSDYYKLTLAGLTASQIGPNAAAWVDAKAMYEYVKGLPLKQHIGVDNHGSYN